VIFALPNGVHLDTVDSEVLGRVKKILFSGHQAL